MRKRLFLSLLLPLCLPWLVQAQLAVIDVADVTQTTISAIQNTIQATEAVFQSVEWTLDLKSLSGIGVAGGIAQDMTTLASLVNQAQGLSYDLSSLNSQITSLFDLTHAPDTSNLLRTRLAQIATVRAQSYSYAMRVQTLLLTALRTVNHLQGLLDTLGGVVGNKQTGQTIGQFQSVTSKHLANMDVQIASFHRAQSVDKMEELLTIESLRQISCHVWERPC